MAQALPSFARGLRLTRLGVFAMLLQLVLTAVLTVKAFGADDAAGAIEMMKWVNYVLLANIAATVMMLIGAIIAIPELSRAHVNVRGLMIGAIGFAVATAALAWTHYSINVVVGVLLDPDSSLDEMVAAAESLESSKLIVIAKDLGYAFGLLTVIGAVERSAAVNDQLALRDEAGHMRRALLIMLGGDLFYQLTYGLGEGGGILVLAGAVAIAGYWIYCHVKLVRFLGNAVHFVDEPHELPIATALKLPDEEPARPRPAPRPSRPVIADLGPAVGAPPPVVVIRPELPVAPAPRASTTGDDAADDAEPPRFLT